MAVRLQPRGLTLPFVALLTAGFGCLLLLIATGHVQTYLDHPALRSRRLMGPAIALLVSGALSVTASWLTYRRRSSALVIFCVSWMLNVIAAVYARLSTHSDPL